MKSFEFLTAVVLAERSLNSPLERSTVILWADVLLARGHENAVIKDLICCSEKSTPAQIEQKVDDCLKVLGLELLSEDKAHILLVWAWIHKLLKSGGELSAIEFLQKMQDLCVGFGHEPAYMQFYLLHCAKKDLAKGTIVFHDRELSEHNFEQVLRWEIDLFLEKNERTALDWIKVRIS